MATRNKGGSMPCVDAVPILEAAYRLDLPEDRWLEALGRQLQGALDHGFGVQVGLYYRTPEGPRQVRFVPIDTADSTLAWCQMVFERVRDDGRCSTADRTGGVFTAQSMFEGSSPTLSQPSSPEDFLSVSALDGTPWVVSATGPAPDHVRVGRRGRALWQRIGAHVSAAYRLRRQLVRGDGSDPPEAILDATGRVLHAEGDARHANARDRLRDAVRRREWARGPEGRKDSVDALAFWDALVEGRWSIVDRFDSDGRRFIVARRNLPEHADPRALTPTERRVARLAAEGLPNKVIAYQLGMASTTVATHLARLCHKLGLRGRGDLAGWLNAHAQVTEVDAGGESLACVQHAPDTQPLSVLTAAEREVVEAVAQGHSDRQIARARSRSVHTIANQLRSASAKLGVTTRWELMALVHGTAAPRADACG